MVSPILILVLFYGVVSPIGLLMRTFGQDPLRLRRDEKASSYWIVCDHDTSKSDMKRQF